ncbi:left-right determination factor 2 [Monodelphis domestica]|uniref:Left-right determination factor n=1 Tax=Monodelphis domestica TaxID=13616 RepID=F6W095_MONDO|nr:left-right determination factor 2 [Monodelphis domestica]
MGYQVLTWAMWGLLLASISAIKIEEKIQESLLRQLHLTAAPVLAKTEVDNLVIPDHVRTKYISLMKHTSEAPFSREKRHSQTIAEIMGRFFSDAFNQLLVFSMKDRLPPTKELIQAVLRLFKKPSPQGEIKRHHKMFPFNSYASVTISWVQIRENNTNRTFVIDSRRVSIHETGWITFDVTQAVNYWQQQGEMAKPLVLEVSIHRENISPLFSNAHKLVYFSSQNPADGKLYAPQLELQTLDMKEYGAQGNCNPDIPVTEATRCCRRETYVNLQGLKWAENWILDPPGFKTYDCVGSCQQPKKEHLNFKWPFLSGRQCIATDTASLPLIVAHKEGDKTLTKVVILHNMKVTKCSCTTEGMPVMKKLKP